jgi:chromosome segregation ATPase
MKNPLFQLFSVCFLVLGLSSHTASAGLFDNDEQNWRRIFGEIKKINARLVSMETGKLKGMENVQQDLSRQIEEVKNLIPTLQGSVEQSQAEISGYFKSTNQKLEDIETQLKLEIIKNIDQQLGKIEQQIASQLGQQKTANDQFQANLAEKFSDLKGGMAADMENFAKINQKNSQELARFNSESLGKVVTQMNTQKESLDRANEIIKSELIPTIIKQNEEASLQLRTEMSKTSNSLLLGMSQANKDNKDALLAGLSGIEAKNQKLLEVLQISLKEGETTRGNIELLSQNMGATNDNVKKLRDAIALQMDTLTKDQQALAIQLGAGSEKVDQKVGVVAQNLQATDEKINKLITTTSELATQNGQIAQSLQTVEGGLANVNLVNDKLTALINILKTIAAEQGKFAGLLTGQTEIKQLQNQMFKSQMELNQAQVKISQGQSAMSKAQFNMGKNQEVINQAQLDEKKNQSGVFKAQEEIRSAQIQILKAQEEIRSAQRLTLKTQKEVQQKLAELSRKANVNISRSDAIRKTLDTLGKKSSPTPRSKP